MCRLSSLPLGSGRRAGGQAVIIWRDELNEGKVFLRDIIDLEATYAGPDVQMHSRRIVR